MSKDKKKFQAFKKDDKYIEILVKQIMADPACHILDRDCLEKLTINVAQEILDRRLKENIINRIKDFPTSQLMEIVCQNKI
jgi:hypothetical protein